MGLETKELFVLAEVDAHPYPAELAAVLCIPKPSVTLYVKRLEAAGFLRHERRLSAAQQVELRSPLEKML